MVIKLRGNSGIILGKTFPDYKLSSFTNKCYNPCIPSPNHLLSLEFTVTLQ